MFSYFFQAVATKQSGGLNLAINGKMFDTSLTSDVTTNVQNEKQKIVIKSTIVPESYVCYFYIKKLFKFKTSQF